MDQWKVLKLDCLPAYITWERYLANQESLAPTSLRSGLQGEPSRRRRAAGRHRRLRQLRPSPPDVLPGSGQALLQLRPASPRGDRADVLRPQGRRRLTTWWRSRSFAPWSPPRLELSCRAMEDIQRDRARLDKHWRQRLERARYEAEDAERRYRAVDPENRLVARSLEQRWEEALRAERQVRDDYDRFLREQPPQLSPEERARIAELSSDLPALWHAPGTTHQDRKEIVRHLVEKVVVHVKNDSEYVDVTIHWHGGFTSQHEVVRPVKSYEQLRDFDKLMDRIAALRARRPHGGADRRLPEPGGIRPAEAVRRVLPRARPPAPDRAAAWRTRRRTPINSGRTSGGCRSWPRRSRCPPASSPTGRAGDGSTRGKTPAQHLWVLWADESGVEAAPQAGGSVSSRRRGVSGRTHHAKGATQWGTWLIARRSSSC